jgi:hypothetical protein
MSRPPALTQGGSRSSWAMLTTIVRWSPVHSDRTLGRGLLRQIMSDIDLIVDDLTR